MTIFRKVFRYTHFVLLSILLIVSSSLGSSFSVTPRIAGGGEHSIALKSDGTVWTWGKNGRGQLGNGKSKDSTVPVQVKNLTGIIGISGGSSHTVALNKNGVVYQWGINFSGLWGEGYNSKPVRVRKLANIVSVVEGGAHKIALEKNGVVWTWGVGNIGQLGHPEGKIGRLIPAPIDNFSLIVQVKN